MISNYKKIINQLSFTPKYIAGFNINALLNQNLVDIKNIEKYLKYNNIKTKLQELNDSLEYLIVFWSHEEHCVIQEILEKLIELLKIKIVYFISTNDDMFKLPNYGTWRILQENLIIDKKKSFYVGDNYGNLDTIKNSKKGFSDLDCSDRKFAKNVNIEFYTPYNYFVNNSNINDNSHNYVLDTYAIDVFRKYSTFGAYRNSPPHKPNKLEFIVCMGCPSSGKSFYINRNYNLIYYQHIQAKYFDSAYIQQLIKSSLNKRKSVILEGSYETLQKRAEALSFIGHHRVTKKCLNVNVGKDLCRHLNNFNMKKTNNQKLDSCVYDRYFKNFEYPFFHEGFDEVIDIPFTPHFNNMNDYILFFEYS